ncbi:MAG: retention module-containing protein, partial [Burkholderiaceae bacterium]|nr:retention module-containing protein [Burkholderiaceae bacterium]
MDTNVTTPQAVATVIAVEGQAFARDPAGQMRPLKPGDVLLEGDTIVTLTGGQVQLAFLDGHMLALLPKETFTFSAETAPTTRPGIDEASLPAGEADRIIQALERGENIDDQIDPPGAGLEGGGNNQGNDFVRLLRIAEGVAPLQFEFGTVLAPVEFPIGVDLNVGGVAATGTITDNDGAPTIASVSDAAVVEGG